MTLEIISRSISMKIWDRAEIELLTPGPAVELTTDCAMGPGELAYQDICAFCTY